MKNNNSNYNVGCFITILIVISAIVLLRYIFPVESSADRRRNIQQLHNASVSITYIETYDECIQENEETDEVCRIYAKNASESLRSHLKAFE